MGYEVDILGVGKASKSGDAITLRWGNLHGRRDEQKVVVIDGGFRESGQNVIDHVKNFYNTTSVDVVVSTHPDQDHVNGLDVVLDKLYIEQLWIHKPWEHNLGLAEKFVDGRVTDNSIGNRLRESLDTAAALVDKAMGMNIRIVEPFTGISLYNQNEFRVLGPTSHYYESLIPKFEGMPKTKSPLALILAEETGSIARATEQFTASWGIDALDDNDTTSAKNNSSAITLLTVDGHHLLFTGDAGITALNYAADELDAIRKNSELRFIQIPHHGSRRNVGPSILDRLIGHSVKKEVKRNICAVASTAKNGEPKHPRKAVMNAFIHRGASTSATRGRTLNYSHHAPDRDGWAQVKVDEYYWN